MRRRLLLIAVLTAGAVAPQAGAADACENPDGLQVITVVGGTSTITTPSQFVTVPVETKEFLLDLGGASSADVTATLSWGLLVNDYDLGLTSSLAGGTSENYQPIDPIGESVTAAASGCDILIVDAIDFLAPVFVDSLSVSFSVANVA